MQPLRGSVLCVKTKTILRGIQTPPGIILFILPLLRDQVTAFKMQVHLMHLNMKWTAVLNPAQTPANVSDQPVHALTKEIQFLDLEMFSRYFPIFGQLHIDQYLLVIHGQLIDG